MDIINKIKTNIKPTKFSPGFILKGQENGQYSCFLITTGLAVVYIAEDREPCYIVHEPTLVGVSQLLCREGSVNVKIMHSANVYIIPELMLLKMMDNNENWKEMAIYLSKISHRLYLQKEIHRKSNTHDLIRRALDMLDKESEEVKLVHTVNSYVRTLTGLSQSTVTRELDMLRKKGNIDIRHGTLFSFNH